MLVGLDKMVVGQRGLQYEMVREISRDDDGDCENDEAFLYESGVGR